MTKQTTIWTIAIAAIVSVIVALSFPGPTSNLATTSPAGSTFNTAKFAAVAMNLATPGTNGTSSSILNTDTNDRFVLAVKGGCENVGSSLTAYTGAGLASLQLNVATSTTAAPASLNGWANVAKAYVVGTTTTNIIFGSSTLVTATSSLAGIWSANTYMTFSWNATNTAACTVGVEYVGA